MQAPNRLYKSDLRGSVSRVKTPCEQGLHHCTYVRATSRSTPSSCDGEGEAQFLHGTWTLRLGHPAWNPQCTHSLGDVGETRWPLSHRWTDTSPILPDVAHDSRNQGRVVSLSVSSLLSAYVRLCQLREVHHSLQQALSPSPRTQSAATDRSPACCTSSLMLRVCVMLRDLLNPPCVHCLCCCCTNSGACPVWPVLLSCLGHGRLLQSRSASDKKLGAL